jgi:hypothetical protein
MGVTMIGIVPSGPVSVTSLRTAAGEKWSLRSLTGPRTVDPFAGVDRTKIDLSDDATGATVVD